MASSSLHQIQLFSLLFSKIYLNVHQKIKVDASHPPTPDPHPGGTALVNYFNLRKICISLITSIVEIFMYFCIFMVLCELYTHIFCKLSILFIVFTYIVKNIYMCMLCVYVFFWKKYNANFLMVSRLQTLIVVSFVTIFFP